MDRINPMMIEADVLLVNANISSLHDTTNLLQMIGSCKVKSTQNATLAAYLLRQSNSTTKFDVVLVDVDFLGFEGSQLIHQALCMGSAVLVMSTKAKRILEKGSVEDRTFLFIQNPPHADVLKYILRIVLKEKTRKISERNNLTETSTASTGNDVCSRRPEASIIWTPELHEKFIDVVRYLGEKRCSPEKILRQINAPGLTIAQVAAHLQKCRANGWIRGFCPNLGANKNMSGERVQVPPRANNFINSPGSPSADDQVAGRNNSNLLDDDWIKVDHHEVADIANTDTAVQRSPGLQMFINMVSQWTGTRGVSK